jgi:hypothetical protein
LEITDGRDFIAAFRPLTMHLTTWLAHLEDRVWEASAVRDTITDILLGTRMRVVQNLSTNLASIYHRASPKSERSGQSLSGRRLPAQAHALNGTGDVAVQIAKCRPGTAPERVGRHTIHV